MQILNLIQCANLGGMEQASLRLMRALKARGHDLRLISLNPIAGLGPLLEEAGIAARGLEYKGRGKLASFIDLKRAISAERPDALIMTGHNFAASLALGGVCKRRMMAMHFHHQGVMPAWRWRLIYRAAKAQFQTITFPSDFVRREAEAIYPPVRSIAETIRNPLDLPPFRDPAVRKAFRERIGVPEDAPLIGNAGWLIQRKRFDVFLQTAAKILALRPEAHFVIAGGGEMLESLQRLSTSLGLAERVSWTGWLSDLAPFYAGIDVLLFNSDWDALGMTPVEAMSHGVPVVASVERGGLAEILDTSCGWLIERHDPEILAEVVLAALSPEGRVKAERAREHIAASCNPAKIAETIELRLLGDRDARAG